MHFPRLRTAPRPSILDWWAYFGSFGDDYFSADDEHEEDQVARGDEAFGRA